MAGRRRMSPGAGGRAGSGGAGSWAPAWTKKPCRGLGPEVALRQQLLVGALHRHHTDLQMGGQGPFGGQMGTRRQTAGLDLAPDMAVKLFIQRPAVPAVQNGGEHVHPSLPLV